MEELDPTAKPPAMLNKLPPLSKRYTKEQVREAVYACDGCVTLLCNVLDCTAQQFWAACERWKLGADVNKAKAQYADKAEAALVGLLGSDNEKIRLDAAKFVLKAKAGWTEVAAAQQLQVEQKDGRLTIRQIFGMPEE